MKGKSRNLPARNAHRLNREGKLRRESKEKGRKKKRIKSRRKRFSQDINGGRFYFYGPIVDISGPALVLILSMALFVHRIKHVP